MTVPLLTAYSSAQHTVEDFTGRVVCLDALKLLAMLPADSIDMVLTSPPYDNLRTYNGYSWDFEGIARETYRVLKIGGVCVWVVGDATVNGSETLTSMRQALYFVDVCGFKMHQTVIWNKPSGAPGYFPKRLERVFEYMFILSKGKLNTFNPLLVKTKTFGRKLKKKSHSTKTGWQQKNEYQKTIHEFKVISNVWTIDKGFGRTATDGTNEHPAMFPEKLAHDHIYTWSNPDDIVLDYFMGSGTTAKIARNLGRKYIGCDLSPEYVALANTRLANSDPYQHTTLPDGSRQLSLFKDLAS